MAPPGVHGAKEGAEGLRGDERGRKKIPHSGIGEPSTLGLGARAGREEVRGELEGPERDDCGGREPPKGPAAGILGGLLPGLGRP